MSQTRDLKKRIQKLLEAQHLLSAQQVQDELEKDGNLYNKTSVYRSLQQLEAEGAVCQLHLGERPGLYELRNDHHLHLLCSICGEVSSAECEYRQPHEVNGFAVDHHHLTLIGVCKNCRDFV